MTRFAPVLAVAVMMSGSAWAAPPAGAHASESQNAANQASTGQASTGQASTGQASVGQASPDQAPPSQGSAGKSARAPAGADAVTPGISCPGDAVVWVNLRSRGYHMQGDRFFGHTRRGRFMCRKAADAAGDHPVRPGSR